VPVCRAVEEVFTSDRRWRFSLAPDELWERVAATDSYRRWWPWLRRFEPVGGFRAGARWSCLVQPPLPYRVRFEVALERVEPHRLAVAVVRGDIEGEAVLTIEPRSGGCEARLRSTLWPTHPLMRRVAAVVPPLVRWGHDWVLDTGARQFVQRAL
jgi:hypothetical protein